MTSHQALLATALFVIFSSSTSYKLTSGLGLPTQKYGSPTRLGLLIHAAVFWLAFVLLQDRV